MEVRLQVLQMKDDTADGMLSPSQWSIPADIALIATVEQGVQNIV